MPIYGYRCGQCGHELEVFQSMSADPLRECPVCGGALGKLLYPVGIQFKGSGFYTTDYRNGGGTPSKAERSEKADKAEKADGASKSDKADKKEGGSDSGSTAKPDTSKASTPDKKADSSAAKD
jgi:putative FmdB family regulatory protein